MAASSTSIPLSPVPRIGNLPLSFAQQRLWSLAQLEPNSSVYNIPVAFRLVGPLNVAALEQSIKEIVRRHEILRTTFSVQNGQAVQVISADQTLTLLVTDLRKFHESKRETEAQWLANEEAQEPFDLVQGPLLRVKLLCLAEEEHILLLTMHHIVSDGWSFNIFFRELTDIYEAFSTGKPSPLPDLPIQYADFAVWQLQWLQGEVLESQFSYWKQQMDGSIAALELPIDRSKPPVQNYQGSRKSLVLTKDLTNALKVLSEREGVTLFMTLLAAFKTLLYRYTGQEDIIVCSPVACRNRVETKGLIGYFNNIVVMRTELYGSQNFRELVARVRQVALGAHEHQDLPFQKLADFPNLVRTPLSRVMFVLHSLSSQPLKLPGITVSSLDVHNGASNFDWSLSMEEKEERLTGILDYKTDLFNATTINQMLRDFQTLLESIVANPEQHLLLLPLFTAIEPNRLFGKNGVPTNFRQKPEETFVPPSADLEIQLTKIWENVLGKKPISVKDNFFDLGGHSLLAVGLLAQIEKTFGKNLPLATLFQSPTIEQLANIVNQSGWSAPCQTLVTIQHGGSKPPLFFLHVLGEGLKLCRPLIRHLDPEQPIYGLAVGIMDEVSLNKVEDVVAHYIKEMRSIQPEGPYFLAGIYCGGRIAYEVALQLHAQGQKVALLALLDTLKDGRAIKIIPVEERVLAHWNNFLRIGPAYLLSKRRLGKAKNRLMSIYYKFYERMRLPLPEAYQNSTYQKKKNEGNMEWVFAPQQVYPERVTLFRAIENIGFFDPDLGWSEQAPGGLEIHDVPGDTFSMLQEPNVQGLAEKLRDCINRVQAEELAHIPSLCSDPFVCDNEEPEG
jgi:thioesterase domain-containing protein/acyl carrier protein